MKEFWDENWPPFVAFGLIVLFVIGAIMLFSAAPHDYGYSWWASNCDLTGAKDNAPVYTCYGVPHKSGYTWPNYKEDPKRLPDGWLR